MLNFQITSKNVVLTTAFNVSIEIAIDFFQSLADQSIQDFDILLINDGFLKMPEIRKKFPFLIIHEIPGLGIISTNRQKLINQARSQYINGIFCDFDDFFSRNRVQESVRFLKEYDIIINDIDLYKNGTIAQSNLFSKELKSLQEVTYNDIIQCNFFGLSNSAVRLDRIPKVIFDIHLKAVDWHFFSLLLAQNLKAIFINSTKTIYRQHENSMANISKKNTKQLRFELQTKLQHYALLKNINRNYSLLLEKMTALEPLITTLSDSDALENFDFYSPSRCGWWSLIKIKME